MSKILRKIYEYISLNHLYLPFPHTSRLVFPKASPSYIFFDALHFSSCPCYPTSGPNIPACVQTLYRNYNHNSSSKWWFYGTVIKVSTWRLQLMFKIELIFFLELLLCLVLFGSQYPPNHQRLECWNNSIPPAPSAYPSSAFQYYSACPYFLIPTISVKL